MFRSTKSTQVIRVLVLTLACLTGAFIMTGTPRKKAVEEYKNAINARITPSTCSLITIGMSENQVQALIGAPPGYYGNPENASDINIGWQFDEPWHRWDWFGDEGAILVAFDSRGKVLDKIFVRSRENHRGRCQ